ncbi:hypothetical protein PR048_009184 [Dryococelus australis]|uniref:Uncharacterized protein n=1 Tax=Dryococelus australis TaxID=614101 RepID=A0ABQ9HZ77_9NEOP|nr:hypothetical protein PR048_009184 [Dryococelus australis]
MKERGKWEIPEKTCRPAAPSGTIPTCENHELEARGLTAQPQWPQRLRKPNTAHDCQVQMEINPSSIIGVEPWPSTRRLRRKAGRGGRGLLGATTHPSSLLSCNILNSRYVKWLSAKFGNTIPHSFIPPLLSETRWRIQPALTSATARLPPASRGEPANPIQASLAQDMWSLPTHPPSHHPASHLSRLVESQGSTPMMLLLQQINNSPTCYIENTFMEFVMVPQLVWQLCPATSTSSLSDDVTVEQVEQMEQMEYMERWSRWIRWSRLNDGAMVDAMIRRTWLCHWYAAVCLLHMVYVDECLRYASFIVGGMVGRYKRFWLVEEVKWVVSDGNEVIRRKLYDEPGRKDGPVKEDFLVGTSHQGRRAAWCSERQFCERSATDCGFWRGSDYAPTSAVPARRGRLFLGSTPVKDDSTTSAELRLFTAIDTAKSHFPQAKRWLTIQLSPELRSMVQLSQLNNRMALVQTLCLTFLKNLETPLDT